ncbi:MAG: hypothetical protein ACMUIA_00375 [bacterium]
MSNGERVRPFFYTILRATTLVILSIIGFLLGCAVKSGPVLVKNGKEYGRIEGIWGGNFWDFYHRGLSYAEGEFWSLAIEDFQQAALMRNRDQRRVRTYGLHIVDDYFPHRETGIVYYETGDYEKAIEALSFSLSCYSSAKAKYYLNRAREAYLRNTRQDTDPPRIRITSHHDQQLVKGFEAIIEGRVRDDWFVGDITINDHPYPCELARPDMPFTATIPLHQGVNEIRIAAKDLVGHGDEVSIRLVADRQAPFLFIDDILMVRNGSGSKVSGMNDSELQREVQITGYIDDLCRITRFQMAGDTVPLLDSEGRFSFRCHLEEPVDTLCFSAEDQLGNRVDGQVRIDQSSERFSSGQPIRLASLKVSGLSGADTHPPSIILDEPKEERLVVDWEELFICGEAQDLGGIEDLLVNDESILPREGKKIYFNHILRLDPGQNIITIKVIDVSGNEKIKTLEVERQVSPVYQIGSRMTMAIIPFKYRGENPDHRQFAADHLIDAFVRQKRFCMVDRERIDQVIAKYLQGNKPDEPEVSPLEVGRLVSAESVLAGSIYENKGFMEIVARLIDTETSVILDTQDVYGAGDMRDFKSLLDGLALKFKQSFPLVEGLIIEKDGRNILVNVGSDKNIKEFTKYIIFREEKNPASTGRSETHGRPGGKARVLGEARILKVFEQISEADLLKDVQDELIQIKDHVLTK